MRAAWKRYGYEGEPPTVNLAEMRDAIRTGDELNRIVAQWQRFNEAKRPGSTQPVEHNGQIVPAQMVREARFAARRENTRRKQMMLDIHPDYEVMTPVEKATAMANKNLHPVDPDTFVNPLDAMGSFGMYGKSDPEYMVKYVDTLLTVAGSDPEMRDLAERIEELMDANPYAMRKILENSKYDQVLNIDFIYRPSDSADKTPWEDYGEQGRKFSGKRSQIIRFWQEKFNEYL